MVLRSFREEGGDKIPSLTVVFRIFRLIMLRPPLNTPGKHFAVMWRMFELERVYQASFPLIQDNVTHEWLVDEVAAGPGGDIVIIGGNESGQEAVKLDAEGTFKWRYEVTKNLDKQSVFDLVAALISRDQLFLKSLRNKETMPNDGG